MQRSPAASLRSPPASTCKISVGTTVLECNALDLDAEPFALVVGGEVYDAVFDDLGGNVCGCADASGTCAAVSSHLDPPGVPLDP